MGALQLQACVRACVGDHQRGEGAAGEDEENRSSPPPAAAAGRGWARVSARVCVEGRAVLPWEGGGAPPVGSEGELDLVEDISGLLWGLRERLICGVFITCAWRELRGGNA